MIAFFDTSVHIDLLRGTLDTDSLLAQTANAPIRLSPVVANELLRGASGRALRSVERLVSKLLPIEPASWCNSWLAAGRLLPRIFPNYEAVGLARLQNDLLLALTARHTGALFVTADSHFATIQKSVPFALKILTRAR